MPAVSGGRNRARKVERRAMRGAKRAMQRRPVGPDLVAPRRGGERVAGRDRVGRRLPRARLDPQQLAEQGVEVLAGVERVSPTAPVPDRDVEVAVGAELQLGEGP